MNYNIEKVNDYYVLYKNIENEKGYCSGAIFKGKRKECEEYLKKVKGGGNGKKKKKRTTIS